MSPLSAMRVTDVQKDPNCKLEQDWVHLQAKKGNLVHHRRIVFEILLDQYENQDEVQLGKVIKSRSALPFLLLLRHAW